MKTHKKMTVVSIQAVLFSVFFSVYGGDTIPRTGMLLWVAADSVQMDGTGVSKLIDMSGKGNSPAHCTDVPNIATVPALVKDANKYNGHAILRFPGSFTGFKFNLITGIRAVFIVISKDSTSCHPAAAPGSCCQDEARFWIGALDGPTNFHADHGCCIFRNDMSEASACIAKDGFASINGGPNIPPALTHMPFKLGLVTLLAKCPVQAGTIGRDRNSSSRSWQGDIAEILMYDNVLDTPTVTKIQNLLMGKYGIDGHTPVVEKNGFSGLREIAPAVSVVQTGRQSMRLALAGAGSYSLKIFNTAGRVVFRKQGISPESMVLNKAQFPNGSYYLTGKIKNTTVHQNMAVVW